MKLSEVHDEDVLVLSEEELPRTYAVVGNPSKETLDRLALEKFEEMHFLRRLNKAFKVLG